MSLFYPAEPVAPEPQRSSQLAEASYRPRRDRRDVFNGRLRCGREVGPYDIPSVAPCDVVPPRLIAFSEAVAASRRPDPTAWVHFYEDDYRYARFERNPEKYFDIIGRYGGMICPDYSTYRNMPRAQQIENTRRNYLLGAAAQARGILVLANVRLNGQESVPWALAGVPRNSFLALGLHGATKSKINRCHVIDEIKIICDQCDPLGLIVYGSDAYRVFDYPDACGMPVKVYPPDTWRRSADRRMN